MIALTARFIALLMLTAIAAAVPGPAFAGPAERRAEAAGAAAKRDKDATEKLRANKPFAHERRAALRRYRDALERAERREEKAALKAANAARDAEQAARKAASAGRERKLRQRREKRKERLQLETDGS